MRRCLVVAAGLAVSSEAFAPVRFPSTSLAATAATSVWPPAISTRISGANAETPNQRSSFVVRRSALGGPRSAFDVWHRGLLEPRPRVDAADAPHHKFGAGKASAYIAPSLPPPSLPPPPPPPRHTLVHASIDAHHHHPISNRPHLESSAARSRCAPLLRCRRRNRLTPSTSATLRLGVSRAPGSNRKGWCRRRPWQGWGSQR